MVTYPPAADEPPVRLAAHIDCASSETVELLTRDADKFRTPAVADRYLGRGLSGDIYGREGTVTRIRIGSCELTNVLVAIVPATVGSSKPAPAVVANGLLRRFNVIYDYASQKLYIKPNAHLTERTGSGSASGHRCRRNRGPIETLRALSERGR